MFTRTLLYECGDSRKEKVSPFAIPRAPQAERPTFTETLFVASRIS
jgi:hypothetical protein